MDVVQIFEEVQCIRRERDVSHFSDNLLFGPQDTPVGVWKNERDSVVRSSQIVWEGLEGEVGCQRAVGGGIRSRRGCPESFLSRS